MFHMVEESLLRRFFWVVACFKGWIEWLKADVFQCEKTAIVNERSPYLFQGTIIV